MQSWCYKVLSFRMFMFPWSLISSNSFTKDANLQLLVTAIMHLFCYHKFFCSNFLGGIPPVHPPFPPPVMTPHSHHQSPYPYPPAQPHGAMPAGGYEAAVPPMSPHVGVPPPMPPYSQYGPGGYGGYTGGQQKVSDIVFFPLCQGSS